MYIRNWSWYPEKFHNLNNINNLAPKKIETKKRYVIKLLPKIANKFNTSICGVKKVVPNLCNKNKYIL